MANVTITVNTADVDDDAIGNGGGLFLTDFNGKVGQAHMRNTILAGNHDLSDFPARKAFDCDGEIDSQGYNLIGTLGSSILAGNPCSLVGDMTGNMIGEDPLLAAMTDNGGPTPTQALMPGSPAINGGNPAGCMGAEAQPLMVDQRGGLRPDRCDIGAYELGALIEHLFLPVATRP